MEENSISIINRTNGQLTGEKAQSIPVKISFSWIKIFLAGGALTLLILLGIFFSIKQQVQVVEVVGKSDNFQLFEMK